MLDILLQPTSFAILIGVVMIEYISIVCSTGQVTHEFTESIITIC